MGTVTRAYNNDFMVKSISVNGNPVNITYDNDGLISAAGSLTVTRNAQNGFMTGTSLGSVTDSYTYDSFGQMTAYTAKISGAAAYGVQFQYDAIGRITRKTETTGGVATTYDYTSNVSGFLTAVKENGVTVSTYDYDSNGNRISAIT